MKCLFLYNPNSGRGMIARRMKTIRRKLASRYSEVDVCITQSAEELEARVREGAEKYHAIIFSGGDGTCNNVIHAAEGKNIQLGYIPSGTVNDVARSLGIPRTVRGSLKVILNGRSQLLDCMRIGDRYAMYIAAAGAFTSATYHTPQAQKRALGALAYAFEGIRHNMDLDVFPVDVTVDGKRVHTHAVMVLVLNGRSVAGFPINKQGSMCDGRLETVIIRQVRKPNLLRRVGALFSVASLFVFGCRIKKNGYQLSVRIARLHSYARSRRVGLRWRRGLQRRCSDRTVPEKRTPFCAQE